MQFLKGNNIYFIFIFIISILKISFYSNLTDLTIEEANIFIQFFEQKMEVLKIKKDYFSLVQKNKKNFIDINNYEIRKKYYEDFEKTSLNYYNKISNYR